MGNDAGEGGFTVVGIKPKTAMGDASSTFHPCGFNYHQGCPRVSEHAQVVDVPIIRNAVIGAVLTHRRDDNPVFEIKLRETNGGKESAGHGGD
jgi:hypothetical protein